MRKDKPARLGLSANDLPIGQHPTGCGLPSTWILPAVKKVEYPPFLTWSESGEQPAVPGAARQDEWSTRKAFKVIARIFAGAVASQHPCGRAGRRPNLNGNNDRGRCDAAAIKCRNFKIRQTDAQWSPRAARPSPAHHRPYRASPAQEPEWLLQSPSLNRNRNDCRQRSQHGMPEIRSTWP